MEFSHLTCIDKDCDMFCRKVVRLKQGNLKSICLTCGSFLSPYDDLIGLYGEMLKNERGDKTENSNYGTIRLHTEGF